MSDPIMTPKQLRKAKQKLILLEKFGMFNEILSLNQRIDISSDVKKIQKKGYKIVDVASKEFSERLCKPEVVGTRRVKVGEKVLNTWLLTKREPVYETQEEKRVPALCNSSLADWYNGIPLAVLKKIDKAKKDGLKHFQVYFPQSYNSYSFAGNCNDPVVVGYASEGKQKRCPGDTPGLYNNPVVCTAPKNDCNKNHWHRYPIGPAFEIASWLPCDVEKEGI